MMEDVVDMEEFSGESNHSLKWLFCWKGEVRKHRMGRANGGMKKFGCTRCGMKSLYDRVSGVCNGLKWVTENQERGKNAGHRWKDKIAGGHHLLRVVDVRRVRTLIW